MARPWRATSALVAVLVFQPIALAASSSLPSVFLEDLTTAEVVAAIRDGKTTIVIPVGGTEQNGPHMALGKHNVRAKALAGKVAQQLGNALVAPGRSHSECRTARHSALEKRVRIESLLAFLVVGVVAGWLAGQIVRGRGYGLLVNLVVGVLGAFIAGWLLPKLGVSVGGGLLADIIEWIT